MNTYNVVVTVSTTVCIDAENPDDAIEKVSQALNNGDVNMSTDIANNIGYSMRNGHYEVTDAIPMDEDYDEDKLMEQALEAGAEDFSADEGVYEITTEPDDVYAVADALKALGYNITSAEVAKVPSTYVNIDGEEDQRFMGLLLDKLDEDDDVLDVYHNWENCDR